MSQLNRYEVKVILRFKNGEEFTIELKDWGDSLLSLAERSEVAGVGIEGTRVKELERIKFESRLDIPK